MQPGLEVVPNSSYANCSWARWTVRWGVVVGFVGVSSISCWVGVRSIGFMALFYLMLAYFCGSVQEIDKEWIEKSQSWETS